MANESVSQPDNSLKDLQFKLGVVVAATIVSGAVAAYFMGASAKSIGIGVVVATVVYFGGKFAFANE